MTPNTEVLVDVDGVLTDVDYNSWQEGKDGSNGNPTYAIITSRSYHPGGVMVATLDGAVRFVSDDIALGVWRAAATRAGGEVARLD